MNPLSDSLGRGHGDQPGRRNRLFDALDSSFESSASAFTPGLPRNTPLTTAPSTATSIPNQHRRVNLASLLASPDFSVPLSLASTAPFALPRNRLDPQGQPQGAYTWNMTEFDDRWLLRSNDIWNVDPASTSTTTMAPDAVRSNDGSQVGSSQLSSTYPRAVSELQEVIDTNIIVRELFGENRRITCVFPYPDDAVRHMLYTRLFNNGDGPAALTEDDAAEMFVYRGNFISRQVVRHEVLAIIDTLVQTMTRDPSAEYNNPEARLSDWLADTSLPVENLVVQGGSGNVQSQIVKGAATRPTSAARNHAFRTLSAPSLHALQQAQESSNTSAQPMASASRSVPAAAHQAPQTVHQGQVVPMMHPQPQSVNQPVFMPNMAAPNAPMYVTAGPGPAAHPYQLPGLGPYPTPVPPHLFANQVQHPNPVYLPPPQHAPWAMSGLGPWQMGHPGYIYGAPQLPMFHQQPYHPPQVPGPQHMPHQRPMLNLNPFPNALGPPATSTAMAMAASGTSAPGPNIMGVPRTVLPASSIRQARTSGWARQAPSFNVAAWAQEHRPPTPANGAPATSSSAPDPPNVEWKNRFGNKAGTGGRIPDLQTLPYLANANVGQPSTNAGPSQQFQNLVSQGAPAAPAMTDPTNMPFVNNASGSRPAQWGVMRIGNIPYGLTKQEVLAFLGKNAKIVTADLGSPIHIVMDRLTGKTMDCYVEFFSVGDAQAAVNAKTRPGNIHKLGDRVAEVGMSSQDELMKELFPKAKQVEWDSGVPIIIETNEPFNSGFKSFVTGEELVMLVKHAEFPQRSTYTARCPQRTYESMISTLYKFPWYAPHLTTLATRNALFEAVLGLIRVLVSILRRTTSYTILGYPPNAQTSHWSATYGATGLTHALLQDLLLAGLNASGFSESQRWDFVGAAEWAGEKIRLGPLARWWPFEVLGRKMGVEADVLEYYVHHLTAHLATNHPMATQTHNPFRTFSVPPNPKHHAATLAEQGEHELGYVLQLYGYVLPAQ